MHALAPYSIRVHDKNLAGQLNERYHDLCNIRGNNFLEIFKDFAESNQEKYLTYDKDNVKKIIRFTDVIEKNGFLSGFIEHGDYGIKSKIVDVESGKEKYKKKSTESDIYQLYFCICISAGETTGICLFHSIGGRGVKTIINDLFNNYFYDVTEGLKAQIHPLSSQKAIEEWMKSADIKELRLMEYTPKTKVSDIVDKLAQNTAELIYKPNRGRSFGTLLGLKKKIDEDDDKVVSTLGQYCTTVKATVKLGERMRVFKLDSKMTPHSAIEFSDEDVAMDEGVPLLPGLNKFSKELIKDFQSEM